MDRRYRDVNGNIIHDQAFLAGLSDDNRFFVLCCQPDGSFTYVRESAGKWNLTISTNGEHLHQPIGEYWAGRLNSKGDTLLDALKKTVKYASTIEKTISPTYNYTIIRKQSNGNIR
jgi:hypothetical protein